MRRSKSRPSTRPGSEDAPPFQLTQAPPRRSSVARTIGASPPGAGRQWPWPATIGGRLVTATTGRSTAVPGARVGVSSAPTTAFVDPSRLVVAARAVAVMWCLLYDSFSRSGTVTHASVGGSDALPRLEGRRARRLPPVSPGAGCRPGARRPLLPAQPASGSRHGNGSVTIAGRRARPPHSSSRRLGGVVTRSRSPGPSLRRSVLPGLMPAPLHVLLRSPASRVRCVDAASPGLRNRRRGRPRFRTPQ